MCFIFFVPSYTQKEFRIQVTYTHHCLRKRDSITSKTCFSSKNHVNERTGRVEAPK